MRKLLVLAVLLLGIGHASAQVNVTTHLYDNNNSGWQQHETTLTAANAASISIKQTLTVDGQVDAQPLIYNGVMYVVTNNNTLYAFNATTGALVTSRNFGAPVPASVSTCTNNDVVIGATGTPVIDAATNILYFVAYLYPASVPTYKIFAVNTSDLTDAITPQVVSASGTLTNSATYTFNATVTKQRPALKLAGNFIYVGWGSFCDFSTSLIRGWLMSFNKSTLALNVSYLTDQIGPVGGFALTSVWQSGTGPVIDGNGKVYVVSSNTGPGTYNQTANLGESVIKFNADLTLNDYFTANQQQTYDGGDQDLGTTGMMMLPTLGGALPHVGIIGSKQNSYRFINLDNLGHFVSSGAPELTISAHTTFNAGGLWGGFVSYYGPDGVLRVLIPSNSSPTQQIHIIDVFTDPGFKHGYDQSTDASLNPPGVIRSGENGGAGITSGQQNGFFMSVSCNAAPRTGFCYSGTAVLWMIAHPTGGSTNTTPPALLMFNAVTGLQLGTRISIGNWPNVGGVMNAVPVVANGHVYACSFQACYIFGL